MDDYTENSLITLIQIVADIPFNRLLGLTWENPEERPISLSFPAKHELIGNYHFGILHGGVTASVLDMAGGLAAMASLADKYPETPKEAFQALMAHTKTIDLHVQYIKPGRGNIFTATAALTHQGKKITFAEMVLWNEKKEKLATASGTYLTS